MASDSLQIISRLLVARLVNEVRGCLKMTLADYHNEAVNAEQNHRIANAVNPNILTALCSIGEIVLILSICNCDGLAQNSRFLYILLNTVRIYVLTISSSFMEFVMPIFTISSSSSGSSSSYFSVAQLCDLILQCFYVGLILYDLRSHLTTHLRPHLTKTEPNCKANQKPPISKGMTDSNENNIIEGCTKKCTLPMIRREDSKTIDDNALTENEVKQFYLGIPSIKTDKYPQPENLPFDKALEISNIQLTLAAKNHPSEVTGFYGTLQQGLLRRTNVKLKLEVGIKSNKFELGKQDFKRFLTELKIMHFVGRHDNILGID